VTLKNISLVKGPPKVSEFCALRQRVGWGNTCSEMARQSLQNSLYSVCIYIDKKLCATGRVVGDGAMYFYIQDVIVDPEYQGQGLGHEIMLQIEQYLLTAAKKGATIGLMAALGKAGFYLRYGYIERPSEALGSGMCRFI
jgi:GNAT superfamily N-acetyltransferase